jgi:hypothetical protein
LSATTVPPVRLGAADRLRSLARGRPEDPAWVRPGIAAALLLPQALCTIAAVALLYATVRRVPRPPPVYWRSPPWRSRR